MKKSAIIFKGVLAAFVLFASAALVSCEKEVETPNPGTDAKKPVSVQFSYTNMESEDMLEYCNIIMEYTDVNGIKVDTISTTEWKKVYTTTLPCTYSFKKTYTLKEDKDMLSVEKIEFYKDGYDYEYQIFDVNGEEFKPKVNGNVNNPIRPSSSSNVAEHVSTGYFNTVHEFVFDSDGKLKLDGK